MGKIIFPVSILILLVLLVSTPQQTGLAVGPYSPIEDTYTDINYPTGNYGPLPFMMLTAAQYDICVQSTYVWLKFLVPNPTTTITNAFLYVPMDALYPGNELLPMELVYSPDVSWHQFSLTWANQPPVLPDVLATSPSVVYPSDAIFTGSTLAAFLEAHKGMPVSLVVRANCAQPVAFNPLRIIASIENDDPSSDHVSLELQGPTAVKLANQKASSAPSIEAHLLGGLLIQFMVIIVIKEITARKRQ